MTLMLCSYLMLTVSHRLAGQLIAETVVFGLGLGLALGALANLIVASVRQEQTGVATAMNTVARTLGGAFGAQVAVSCITSGGGVPTDRGFTLAFAVCAVCTALGVASALAVPRRRAGRAGATQVTRVGQTTADLTARPPAAGPAFGR